MGFVSMGLNNPGLCWADLGTVCHVLSENERARLFAGGQMTCARLVLLDMLPFSSLFCLSLFTLWGLLAALVGRLSLTACGFFHCIVIL